jgi:signal peptidase I
MDGNNPFIQPEVQTVESNVFIDLLQTIVVALSICVVIYLFIATPNEVHGQSMEPNFHDSELLLTNKVIQFVGNTGLKNIIGDYKRGDVVIFKHTLSQEDFIKRIIAAGGDTIMVKDGSVYVNNVKLNETYLSKSQRTESGNFLTEGQMIKVPDGNYIVFGDNRDNSTDSRSSIVGFVKRSQMKGKVFFRYWPLDNFGTIKGNKYEELNSYNSISYIC